MGMIGVAHFPSTTLPRRWRKYARLLLGIAGIIVLLSGWAVVLSGVLAGRPLFEAEKPIGAATIRSADMEPSLKVGARIAYYRRDPAAIKRGEIVVYRLPTEWGERILVKRAVALPGDTVEINQGQLIVNGAVVQESYVSEPMDYLVLPFRLEPGQFYVLGDRRNTAVDSHLHGPIVAGQILGIAVPE